MNTKIALILGAFISLSVETDSSPAESPVYGLKGASVHLTAEGLQNLQIIRITWKYNNTDILEHSLDSSPSYYNGNYKEKIQFDSSDFSLLIKNLDETNQGTYTAIIKDKKRKDFLKANYHLHVLEAVSKPVIQMMPLSLSSAEGFCNVSVNCSVRDSWVYYTCDQTQCSQTEPQSWPDVNITVSVYNGNIICTGSNRVSKETHSEPCKKTAAVSETQSSWYIWLVVPGIVCLCIGFICFKRRRNRHTRNSEDGANNTYMMSSTADRASPPNTPQDNTVYCTVGHPKDLPHGTAPPAHCDDTSVYSQVKK